MKRLLLANRGIFGQHPKHFGPSKLPKECGFDLSEPDPRFGPHPIDRNHQKYSGVQHDRPLITDQKSNTIDLANQKTGIYTIQIELENGSASQHKIIKN